MKTIYRSLKAINRLMAEATGYLVALLVLLLVLDTLGYLFNLQLHGLIELSVFIVVASAYLGLSYTEENRGHIRVTALYGRFPPKLRQGLDIFWGIVTLAVVSAAAYAAFLKAMTAYRVGEALAGQVPYPLSPIRFVIAISLLLYCFQITANLIIDIASCRRNTTESSQ